LRKESKDGTSAVELEGVGVAGICLGPVAVDSLLGIKWASAIFHTLEMTRSLNSMFIQIKIVARVHQLHAIEYGNHCHN